MINFESYINLPMIWGGIIVLAIIIYVILDGFDLGVGILFPFAPSDDCRNKMINSIAPFWDGNETWLILGGGGLFAAFPLAYGVLMSALYMPVLFMLAALIFRGVAFEFRFKSTPNHRWFWDFAFHFGSLVAAFMQGVMLGALVQGISVTGRLFSGGMFDWLSAFSMMTGVAVVSGYILLGATWMLMKTCGETQEWANKMAKYIAVYVFFFLGLVSLWVPFLDPEINQRWFSWPNIAVLMWVPVGVIACAAGLYYALEKKREIIPFILTLVIFLLSYVGLIISLWPWIVPRQISFVDAAAAPESQSLMLCATVLILPIILGYTAYVYYVFRGKASTEAMY